MTNASHFSVEFDSKLTARFKKKWYSGAQGIGTGRLFYCLGECHDSQYVNDSQYHC